MISVFKLLQFIEYRDIRGLYVNLYREYNTSHILDVRKVGHLNIKTTLRHAF